MLLVAHGSSVLDKTTNAWAVRKINDKWSRNYFIALNTFSIVCFQKLHVHFLEFAVEYQARCIWDWLAVYDRHVTSDSQLGKYCGLSSPPDVITDTSHLVLQFVSDAIIPEKGFRLLVTAVGESK
ncbi:hypothetical protein BaRGS_00032159 [Batillaria attramentaria]|uniref:CUB domain-containing protein n=1 Tax=Batillaria attramentaria TaxID=370345 RepID=A0ABD0JP90_9CAEN